MTSRRISDGFSAPQSRKPSAPSDAVTTSKPSCFSVYCSRRWTFGSSSTTRILAAIVRSLSSVWDSLARGDQAGASIAAGLAGPTRWDGRNPPVRSASACLLRGRTSVAHAPLDEARERLHEPGEFGGDDELRGRAGTQCLEGLEVLERHRLLVDPGGRLEDPGQRLAEALGPQDGRLAVAFGLQDLGLLLALGDIDRRLASSLGFSDHCAPRPLG